MWKLCKLKDIIQIFIDNFTAMQRVHVKYCQMSKHSDIVGKKTSQISLLLCFSIFFLFGFKITYNTYLSICLSNYVTIYLYLYSLLLLPLPPFPLILPPSIFTILFLSYFLSHSLLPFPSFLCVFLLNLR